MTSQDAKHTLDVYAWIAAHLDELQQIAEQPGQDEVSAQEVQEQFHRQYTQLCSTRFVPLTLTLFTDEDTLQAGKTAPPNVILGQPCCTKAYVLVDHLHTTQLGEVTEMLGISGAEQTWKLTW